MKRCLFLLVLGLFSSMFASDLPEQSSDWVKAPEREWYIHYDKAVEAARKSNKLIYVFRTGSDWCGFCVKLKREVLGGSKFKRLQKKHFIFLYLDFPRRTTLPDTQKRHNSEACRMNGLNGGFPTAKLITPDGEEVGKIVGYRPEARYIKELEAIIRKKTAVAPEIKKDFSAESQKTERQLSKQELEQKLSRIVIKHIYFEQTPLSSAVKYLRDLSKIHSIDRIGVNIIVHNPARTRLTTESEENVEPKISMIRRNVTLLTALRDLCECLGWSPPEIGNNAVVLAPKNVALENAEVKTPVRKRTSATTVQTFRRALPQDKGTYMSVLSMGTSRNGEGLIFPQELQVETGEYIYFRIQCKLPPGRSAKVLIVPPFGSSKVQSSRLGKDDCELTVGLTFTEPFEFKELELRLIPIDSNTPLETRFIPVKINWLNRRQAE